MRVVAAVGVLFALSLSGCAAGPPPGPTDDEIAALRQHTLDETWANTGLPGDPPAVEPGPAVAGDAWGEAIASCVAQRGFALRAFQFSPDSGAALMTTAGDTVTDPEAQLDFYRCIAANPRVADDYDLALTDAQLDYIYDYYQSTLVPCMIMNGFTPSTAPSRVEFLALAGDWSPYYSVDVGLTGVQYAEIERICGPERPELY